MSTVKDPEEKKSLSLKLDRRNTYGENSNASRTGIRRGKQRRHMNERRAVGAVLSQLKGSVQDDEATNAELLAKTSVTGSQRRGFKKQPDVSLGVVLATKRAGKPKFTAPHRPR
jgi:hypothetical protein